MSWKCATAFQTMTHLAVQDFILQISEREAYFCSEEENVASGREDPSSLRASWLNWAEFHNQCSYENDRRSFLAKLHQPGSHLCNVEHVQFYDVFSSENRWMIYRKKALDSIQYVTDKTMHSILTMNFQMENRRLWCLRLMQYCCNFETFFFLV